MSKRTHNLKPLLLSIARQYPCELRKMAMDDVDRMAFHIELVLGSKSRSARLLDVGGGMGYFAIACAALGMDAVVVDDFDDPINKQIGDGIFNIHRSYGVQVIRRDALKDSLEALDEPWTDHVVRRDRTLAQLTQAIVS